MEPGLLVCARARVSYSILLITCDNIIENDDRMTKSQRFPLALGSRSSKF